MKQFTKYIKVAKLANKKNTYIVYDSRTMKPLSGIKGQSRSVAYRIRSNIQKRVR